MNHTGTFRGHTFNICEGSTHPAYSLACFQPGGEEYDFRERYWSINPGDVVVDAGASYGAYTLTALAAGAAKVVAFEPEPTVLVDLRRNLAANGWTPPRCFAFGFALWDAPDDSVNMADYAPHWPRQAITGKYPAATLDAIMARDSRLDWLKVDVEGAEVHALRGALKTIERLRPRLVIEAHTFLDSEIADKCKALLPGYAWEEVPREPCVMLIGECK